MKTRNHNPNRVARFEVLEDRRMMSAEMGPDPSQVQVAANDLVCCDHAEIAVCAGSMEAGVAHQAADRPTVRSIVETRKESELPCLGGFVGAGGLVSPIDWATECARLQAHESVIAVLSATTVNHVQSSGVFSLFDDPPVLPTQGANRPVQILSVSAEGQTAGSEGGRKFESTRGELASKTLVRQTVESASEHTPVDLAVTPTDSVGGKVWELVKKAASAVGEAAQKAGEAVGQAVKTGWAIVKKAPGVNLIVSGVTQVQEGAKFGNAPTIDASRLQPGDVLVFKGDGVMRSVIKYGTESSFNHSAIYAGNGMVIDAIGDGVVKRSLEDALRDQNFAGVLRREGLTEVQRQAIVSTAETWIGAKYSYKNCLKTGMGLIVISGDVRPAVTCSEFVQQVYHEAIGYRIADRDYPSPGDLAMASGLKAVGRLKDEPSPIAIRGPLGIPVVKVGTTPSLLTPQGIRGLCVGGMRSV